MNDNIFETMEMKTTSFESFQKRYELCDMNFNTLGESDYEKNIVEMLGKEFLKMVDGKMLDFNGVGAFIVRDTYTGKMTTVDVTEMYKLYMQLRALNVL